jgi:hypothetical protein
MPGCVSSSSTYRYVPHLTPDPIYQQVSTINRGSGILMGVVPTYLSYLIQMMSPLRL